jgi:hypothetical protein
MKTVPYYVLALALSLPAILVGFEIPSFLLLGTPSLAFQSDLRVLYTPAYMLRTHQSRQIYDFAAIRRNQDLKVAADNGAVPYLHPAYEALFLIPLSFLPYRAAYLGWALMNVIVLACVYSALRPRLVHFRALGPPWISAGLLLGFFPLAFSILAGQDSLLLLLILTWAFRCMSGSHFRAGVLLGFGMFRFQVLLPIVVLFLLWRSFKLISGWALSSAAVAAISAGITGVEAQLQYFRLLFQMGSFSYQPLLRRMPNLRGLLAAFSFGKFSIVILSAAILLIAAVMGTKQGSEQRFSIAISVACLVTYFLFMHDLSLLILPILLAMDAAIVSGNWRGFVLVSTVPILFAMFWFATDHFYLGGLFTLLFLMTQLIEPWNHKARNCDNAG